MTPLEPTGLGNSLHAFLLGTQGASESAAVVVDATQLHLLPALTK
jgi:hypothetical protein